MQFAFIPQATYTIGQRVSLHGKPMQVISYSYTGKNLVVTSLANAPKFEKILCILTDEPPIEGITS